MATITAVSLKGGAGKTGLIWTVATYFHTHYKRMGFNTLNLIDLDYLQSNMEQYNNKRIGSKKMNVFTVLDKDNFISLSEDILFDESALNIIDTGRYDSETNFLSYVTSDILLVVLNPAEEIEFRNAIATLYKMDEIFTKENVETPLVRVVYTRVHPNSKFSSFTAQNEFIKNLEFKTIEPKLYQSVIYKNKLLTVGSQYGESIWDVKQEKSSTRVIERTRELMLDIKADLKIIKEK